MPALGARARAFFGISAWGVVSQQIYLNAGRHNSGRALGGGDVAHLPVSGAWSGPVWVLATPTQ